MNSFAVCSRLLPQPLARVASRHPVCMESRPKRGDWEHRRSMFMANRPLQGSEGAATHNDAQASDFFTANSPQEAVENP